MFGEGYRLIIRIMFQNLYINGEGCYNFLNKLYNSSFNWGCFEIKSETLNFLIKILYFLNYFNSPSLKIIINHSLFHTTCNKLGSLSLSLITGSSFMGVIITIHNQGWSRSIPNSHYYWSIIVPKIIWEMGSYIWEW